MCLMIHWNNKLKIQANNLGMKIPKRSVCGTCRERQLVFIWTQKQNVMRKWICQYYQTGYLLFSRGDYVVSPCQSPIWNILIIYFSLNLKLHLSSPGVPGVLYVHSFQFHSSCFASNTCVWIGYWWSWGDLKLWCTYVECL